MLRTEPNPGRYAENIRADVAFDKPFDLLQSTGRLVRGVEFVIALGRRKLDEIIRNVVKMFGLPESHLHLNWS